MTRDEYIAHAAPRIGAANARRQWDAMTAHDMKTRRDRIANAAGFILASLTIAGVALALVAHLLAHP